MRTRAIVVRGCVLAGALGWSATASAFMGYPAVVDTWLGKSGLIQTIEPPMGCELCHVSDQGGTVELRPFGDLLVANYGLPRTAEEDTVLMGALAGLKAANPKLFTDMQHGVEPNTDPALTAEELPQPEYGCSVARAKSGGPLGIGILFAGLPLACALRRRRRDRATTPAPGNAGRL
jgi:hypothetical protein